MRLILYILLAERNRYYFLDSFFQLVRADIILATPRFLVLIYWFTFYLLITLIIAFQRLVRRPWPAAQVLFSFQMAERCQKPPEFKRIDLLILRLRAQRCVFLLWLVVF